MRVRVVLGGLVAIAAACTKESVRPSVVEAGAALEADAGVSAMASASASASATPVDAAPSASATASAAVAAVDAASTTTTASREVSLDQAAEGKTVEVVKGATVTLLLAATPSSGFDWAVLKAPAALGTPTMGFVAGGDPVGGAGKRRIVWNVKDALPPGEHAVELGYARGFEKGVAPFKTFHFKVRAAK